MAETGGNEERTEAPTQRRLERAFEEGTVQQPQEFYFLAALTLAALLAALTGLLFDRLKSYALLVYDALDARRFDRPADVDLAGSALWALAALPVTTVLGFFLIAALVGLAQQRFQLRFRPLRASLDNVSPLKGFQRLFGKSGQQRILSSLVKIVCVTIVLGLVLWALVDATFVRGDLVSLSLALAFARRFAVPAVAAALALVAAIACADLLLKRWATLRELRMSRQEIKEEMRESEGNPEVAARLRQIRRKRRTLSRKHPLKTAEVLLTNPTHYAVAVAYFPQQGTAPIVIGKGAGIFARRLRLLAWQAGIPILREPQLTRELFRSTDVDEEIPETLFAEVARILVYVYRLKRKIA
jgi:flagellar biosynthesis protein FlhB